MGRETLVNPQHLRVFMVVPASLLLALTDQASDLRRSGASPPLRETSA